MSFLKLAWQWAKSHISWKDIAYLLIIAALIVILSASIRSCTNNQEMYNNNIHALTDTIAYYQSENGALIATKTAFESNIKELKLANSDLYAELEDMKIKLKNVVSAVNTSGEIIFEPSDTVYIVKRDTIGNFVQQFDFSNQWRTLNGKLSFNSPESLRMSIDNDKVLFDYTIAMDNDNMVYVKSNNPYVSFNELSGFVIPKEKRKHFSIGPTIGIGYGAISQKPDVFIGISASWKFFEF